MSFKNVSSFENGECFTRIDAIGFEKFCCEYFSKGALERKATIAPARIGSGSTALGAQIQKFSCALKLSEEKASTITKVRIVLLKLVAVVAQCQGL